MTTWTATGDRGYIALCLGAEVSCLLLCHLFPQETIHEPVENFIALHKYYFLKTASSSKV
jgi:hypothetical protein